jgi:hypothetical protein
MPVDAKSDADVLFEAAWRNDTASIVKLLDEGTDINAAEERGLPALCAAIENLSYDGFVLLLSRGANPHSYGNVGNWTPLAHAVEYVVLCQTDNVKSGVEPLIAIIELLIKRGADPSSVGGPLKMSPLEYGERLRQGSTRELADRLLRLFRLVTTKST